LLPEVAEVVLAHIVLDFAGSDALVVGTTSTKRQVRITTATSSVMRSILNSDDGNGESFLPPAASSKPRLDFF
jgi:hypothetical protein